MNVCQFPSQAAELTSSEISNIRLGLKHFY